MRCALVRWVVSWPPPWLAVLTKKVAGLQTREPCFQRPPVASQKALNCAAADPYLCASREGTLCCHMVATPVPLFATN